MPFARRAFAVLIVIAVFSCARTVIPVWTESNIAVSAAEMMLAVGKRGNQSLTTAESVIAFSEFNTSWNNKSFPCPTFSALWRNLAHSEAALTNAPVSSSVIRLIENKINTDHIVRKHLILLLTACRLEQKYSNTEFLRAYVRHAYFGKGDYGIEAAAQSMFDKRPSDLTIIEASKLAAVLRTPFYRDEPEKLQARAETITNAYQDWLVEDSNERSPPIPETGPA